jgi:hypothetical protein
MRYLGKKSVSSSLKLFVDIIWYFSLITIIPNVIGVFYVVTSLSSENILFHIIFEITFIAFLLIVYELRKIFKSLTIKEPFITENVRRFRIIGVSIIFIGIFDFIYNINKYGINGFYILHMDAQGFSSRCGVLIYVFLGIMALVLAEIFKSAIEMKEENNLTI